MQRIPKAINKKRLVRYKEGAEMYSMGMNKFQTLAKDAGAILKHVIEIDQTAVVHMLSKVISIMEMDDTFLMSL